MKFTRDLCRLLGLGGDGPSEEALEAQDGASDPADDRKGHRTPEATVNNEEGLDEKERAKRRAERRRAKRKRQRERKKLEREEKMEEALEQEEEVEVFGGVVMESNNEEENKEEEPWTAEPEWDVSSAFVANAASHIKLKGPKSRALQVTSENRENKARSSQGTSTEDMKRRGESLTEQGIQMFGRGQYSQAVHMFSEAIFCDPKDHRFYGNRSYCYLCLEQYSSALKDAQRSIDLAPHWPKGFFRKGCALMGLKRYSEAEKAMEQVLKLDQHIKEASSKLVTCRTLQLMDVGSEEEQSELLLQKCNTVQGVLTSEEAKALKQTSLEDHSGSCRSLWVGNITLEVTEKDLWDLFKIIGEIESIRVLHERFCAFINFKNANMAARALEKLQGVELRSTKLVMRYPDRWIQRTLPSAPRTNTCLGFSAAAAQQSSA